MALLSLSLSLSPSLNTPTAAALVALAAWALFRAVQRRLKYDIRHLPGPPASRAHWLWGHEKEVWAGQAEEVYGAWLDAHGPAYKIKGALFHPDIAVVADHAAAQHIFADTDTYVKSPQFRPPIDMLMGKGLVWAEGTEHAQMRRLLAPAFTIEAVKGMADDISECAEKLEGRLTNLVLTNGGSTTLNIVQYMSTCTLDIIGKVALGHDFRSGQSTEAREIAASWHGVVTMAQTFPAFVAQLVLRAFPWITSLPLKPLRTPGVVKVVCGKLTRRLLERGAVATARGNDIWSILMRANEKEKAGGGGLSEAQIEANIATFTMVGHETTAGALNFTVWELARRPEVQARLRKEIVESGRDLSYDDIQKLEYLDAVCKEALRVHAPSPQTERVATRDDVIPLAVPIVLPNGTTLASLRVRKGQVFHVPFMLMNTNRAVWGPDGAAFRPERWITPGGVERGGIPAPGALPHGWSGITTFCDGPRNCIGYRLAVFEYKVILATLVRSLEFAETDARVERKILQTMQPVTDGQGGLLPVAVSLVQP